MNECSPDRTRELFIEYSTEYKELKDNDNKTLESLTRIQKAYEKVNRILDLALELGHVAVEVTHET